MDTKEYNKLLKFLYFEGYSDSYEEAEQLIEEVDDEEFETLYEEFLLTEAVDVVSDYLVSEGFAADAESAMAMFTAMSDDWLSQIVEEMTGPELGAKILAGIKSKDPEERKRMWKRISFKGDLNGLDPTKKEGNPKPRRQGIQSVEYK